MSKRKAPEGEVKAAVSASSDAENPGPVKKPKKSQEAKTIKPRSFEAERCFYARVLNAGIHPMVANFMRLGNERIAARYCHLNPKVDYDALLELLNTAPDYFRWAGCDLFNVTNAQGQRQMIVLETNSCPSGQKSMPALSDEEDADGYHKLMKHTFHPFVSQHKGLPEGRLAVVYDKNPMEAEGYAAAMADVFGEDVFLTELLDEDKDAPVQFRDGVMHVRDSNAKWHPIRAAFRYVTQRPWNRVPVTCRTFILNPIVSCLAGGRNKMAADKAYEFMNKECAATGSGLRIRVPETIRDVTLSEIPLWVKSMGGHAVVKVPYSNAGQGVYTICNQAELDAFMAEEQTYDKYIVQSLVGNASWSSVTRAGQFFHAGTVPNRKNETFVSDLRVMISSNPKGGWQPIAVYARRAHKPLVQNLSASDDSWAMLGTNLSVKSGAGEWSTETDRLLLMDTKDFNRLGLGTDDLIDAYVQTVLATTAIDRMASRLIDKRGRFDFALYSSLNADDSLLKEILLDGKGTASASSSPSL